jgi:hypothetical protein
MICLISPSSFKIGIMKYILALLVAATAFSTSCKKNNENGKEVEIYLLKSYQPVVGKCQVDAATAVLQEIPVVRNDDIVAYSKKEYTFELTDDAIARANKFTNWYAFAVTVDKQVVYYGIFKPFISSSSCDHSITMNNNLPGGNKISVQLGYPGLMTGITIDDQRNNSKLIAALSAQGKLR